MADTQPTAPRRPRAETLLFVLTPLLFASNMLVARVLGGAVPPATLACLRWSVAALVLLPFARGLRTHLGAILSPRFALLALTGGVLAVAPLYAAAARTSAGNIAMIISAAPAFVLVAERVLFGTTLRWPAGLGVTLCGLGVVAVVSHGHPADLLRLSLGLGDLLAFLSMLSWVAYTLLSRRRPVALPPVIGLAGLAMASGLMLLPAALAELVLRAHHGAPVLAVSGRDAAAILFLCLVPSIGAYGSYQRLVRGFGAARAAVSMYGVPVWAMLLGSLLIGETLHGYHYAGLALILDGVSLAALGGQGRTVAARSAAPWSAVRHRA